METFSETKFQLFKLPDLQRTISEIGYIVRAITNKVRTVTTVLKSTCACRRFCKSVISRVPHYNYSLPAYGSRSFVLSLYFPSHTNWISFNSNWFTCLSSGKICPKVYKENELIMYHNQIKTTHSSYRTIGVYFFIQ